MRRGEKRKSRYREDEACVHRHGSFSFTLENGIEDGADATLMARGVVRNSRQMMPSAAKSRITDRVAQVRNQASLTRR